LIEEEENQEEYLSPSSQRKRFVWTDAVEEDVIRLLRREVSKPPIQRLKMKALAEKYGCHPTTMKNHVQKLELEGKIQTDILTAVPTITPDFDLMQATRNFLREKRDGNGEQGLFLGLKGPEEEGGLEEKKEGSSSNSDKNKRSARENREIGIERRGKKDEGRSSSGDDESSLDLVRVVELGIGYLFICRNFPQLNIIMGFKKNCVVVEWTMQEVIKEDLEYELAKEGPGKFYLPVDWFNHLLKQQQDRPYRMRQVIHLDKEIVRSQSLGIQKKELESYVMYIVPFAGEEEDMELL